MSDAIDSQGIVGQKWPVIEVGPLRAAYGGNVKNTAKISLFGALALLGAGMLLTGCKPDLTQANAQALIQAKYDQTAPVGATITVDEVGLKQGATAKYWTITKMYPNKYWADLTLTPDGKKAVKLVSGGDVIQWRPASLEDKKFSVVVQTVAANHLKAKDLKDLQDEVGGNKSVEYTESVVLDGVPAPLQEIAHNPGNKLSSKHQAFFALDGSAWKLQSIN